MTPFTLLYTTAWFSIIASHAASAASADEWKSRSIYQVLGTIMCLFEAKMLIQNQVVTDRFARSDNASPSCDTSQREYCGGTWKGITNHLDYIQDLGFDAVWISPIVKNIETATPYGEAYHGLVVASEHISIIYQFSPSATGPKI